ncbi:MAG: radical SAM family heme chaperone HemW [SAR324 cluster bacterium]|nr:radical SAM family heme chaperone HemW [SAR324 cluster bacterium]
MAAIRALYCHIPFCRTICPFCAFAVHGNRERLHADYLRRLEREIGLAATGNGGPSQPIESLYFGGGTPSTLTLEELEPLMAALRRNFPLSPDAEIAFECNPEDVRGPYLSGLRRLGIDRLSLGIQSFDEKTLAALGRNHDGRRSREALREVQRHGPANYNVDLMFGAPGIDPRAFAGDVAAVIDAEPPHVSLYGLDLEPGTLFARDPAVREWDGRHKQAQAEAYLDAAERLTRAGYRHYEVSNFCRPGYDGRQNRIVWDGGNYLGFGTGAHSHVDGVRRHNHRHLRAYSRSLDAGEAPEAFREALSAVQRANETLMLSLRRDTGLDTAQWERRHGIPWGEARNKTAAALAAAGKAQWAAGRLVLTARGFLVADAVTEQLMAGADEQVAV